MTASVRASAWHDDVRACVLTVLYPIHYVNSDLLCHFLIDGYVIFLSFHCTIPYTWTMYAYDLCVHFSFSCVLMLYPVLSPPISNLDLILPTSVSTLDLVSSLLDITFKTFTTGECICISLLCPSPYLCLSLLGSSNLYNP